ncbi:hypothetical protein [Acinetobacter sp. NIPH 2100]|uniref:hypothetical protein n=1 Tax=Acinetobacter sp. NIPH 2100 TaxID=1217708 RepID=UPI0002CEC412|nr:hypothetical protein [Acinetobacter sp. NIPH 2100]ENX44302.1 hypothetical protein F887_00228 [Acinetobacter sp. NIPH 2100]
MNHLDYTLSQLKNSLCKEVDASSLFTRNKVAHKWKAPWRVVLLRETVAWRVQDLLEQSSVLFNQKLILGARILLRSAFETLAILIYLNQNMRSVLAGKVNFHDFSEKTSQLLLGSRDNSTDYASINILTVLNKADKRYSGLEQWYAALSESAHPNYEGMLSGYSTNDTGSVITYFENRWDDRYGKNHVNTILACLSVFEHEYNYEWVDAFERLEKWIEVNDEYLENTKPKMD